MSKELLPWEAEEIDLSNVSAVKCFLVDGKLMTGDEFKDLLAGDDKCLSCGVELSKTEVEFFDGDCTKCTQSELDDEDDFLSGVTCNPDAPEECESCQ